MRVDDTAIQITQASRYAIPTAFYRCANCGFETITLGEYCFNCHLEEWAIDIPLLVALVEQGTVEYNKNLFVVKSGSQHGTD